MEKLLRHWMNTLNQNLSVQEVIHESIHISSRVYGQLNEIKEFTNSALDTRRLRQIESAIAGLQELHKLMIGFMSEPKEVWHWQSSFATVSEALLSLDFGLKLEINGADTLNSPLPSLPLYAILIGLIHSAADANASWINIVVEYHASALTLTHTDDADREPDWLDSASYSNQSSIDIGLRVALQYTRLESGRVSCQYHKGRGTRIVVEHLRII